MKHAYFGEYHIFLSNFIIMNEISSLHPIMFVGTGSDVG